MENLFTELDLVVNAANLLGYLNFSDGRPDPRWQKQLNDAYGFLAEHGVAEPWQTLYEWLRTRLANLQETGAKGFKEVGQARAILKLAFTKVLPGYRAHHADLLFHLSDRELFQPFFLARVCEAILAHGVNGIREGRSVAEIIDRLNDYVGHRPIAILETRPRGEPYEHERVRPIPLYLRGAGVACGRYQAVLARALEILAQTDPALLGDAYFDLDLLDELALDPRAYDHTHPANRRPNYVFGEWDPHNIDNQGRYRRYVARQITLDALLDRVEAVSGQWSVVSGEGPAALPLTAHHSPLTTHHSREEALFEAAAVLAGTLLMATGVSGSGPSAHDSTTTLSTLMPRIARYRDAFYSELLKRVPGTHGERLRQEAASTRQPFGAARQHFNRYLARHRALQLQQRHLAVLYAELGYADAGREEAARIPTASLRLLSEIQGRLSTGRLLGERGDLAAAAPLLAEITDLLKRGIACGAFVDPWNILGFQVLYPLFPSREDSVRDPRVDELVSLVDQTFDLHAHLMSEAAARGDKAIAEELAKTLGNLAAWWDSFGTFHVADVAHVRGSEAIASAEHVAAALARWHERGQATADLAFWRQHLEGFRSAKAFALVVEALLKKVDYRASMALLVNWLGQAEQVPLEEGEHSFSTLALRWMLGVTAQGRGDSRETLPEQETLRTRTDWQSDLQPEEAWALTRKFFDYAEANAEDYGQVPTLDGHTPDSPVVEDDAGDVYGAAYEDVTYRDSSEDGTQGDLADEGLPIEPFDLADESEYVEKRLRFLSTLARLWQIAARFGFGPRLNGKGDWQSVPQERLAVLSSWRDAARTQQQKLALLLDSLHAVQVPEPVSVQEALVEYDRRRVLKEQLLYTAINACLDSTLAVGALQGAVQAVESGGRTDFQSALKSPPESGPIGEAQWGPLAIRLESALFQGDAEAARATLPAFLRLFQAEPLLFQPLAEGGQPRQILRVRVAQTILRALAGNLPRLGLLRETYHLLRGAWASEQAHPPAGRGVTEFNHLFQTAYQAVVECVIESESDWPVRADADQQLVNLLETLTAPFLTLWIEHSRSLQLSCLEGVRGDKQWNALRDFVKRYGGDLFQARFLTLGNLRGILHHGVGAYLDSLGENPDPLHPIRLLEDIGTTISRDDAVGHLQLILQAVVENYEEYKDYNTTTTLSDYGENLHVLLDFLRLKVNYERHAWQFRPLVLAHEVLAHAGLGEAAVLWEAAFTQLTRELADHHLSQLKNLEEAHGIRLNTVADRLRERFVKPLELDRLCALIESAVHEAGVAGEHSTFAQLRAAIQPLTADPAGVGLDAPYWLRRLEEETQRVRASRSAVVELAEELFEVPERLISRGEIERQLGEWDKPLQAE